MTRLEEMKALATEEAIKLKEHATKAEIKNLRLSSLDPNHQEECIYGQMTGNCYSERALELIRKCCAKVYRPTDQYQNLLSDAVLNGAPYDILPATRKTKYHSPIECLIIDKKVGEDSAEKLIAFLKDETQTLEL